MAQNSFSAKNFSRNIITSVLITAIAFTLIWYYDTKWSLPIVVWLVIIAGAGSPALNWEYIMSILGLLSWVYLWLTICGFLAFRRLVISIVLILLWGIVIESGMSVLRHYNYQLIFDQESSWFYVPASIFMLSSLLSIYISWLLQKPKT